MGLTDQSPPSKLPRKRLGGHGGGDQFRGFSPNFKRPKVDAIRQFPIHCGAFAPRITTKPTQSEEGTILQVNNSGIPVPCDTKPDPTTKPMASLDNVKALWEEMKVDHGEIKTNGEPLSTDVPEKRTEVEQVSATFGVSKLLSQPHPRVRKYPAPKIRQGVTTYRDYPSCFGTLNRTSESCEVSANKFAVDKRQFIDLTRDDGEPIIVEIEDGHDFGKKLEGNTLNEMFGTRNLASQSNKVSADKSIVEKRQLVDLTRDDGEQIIVKIGDGHDFEKQLEGNTLKEMVDEVQAKSTHLAGNETGTHIEGGKTSEYQVKQDKGGVETSTISPSEINLLQPDSSVWGEERGSKGKEIEEYCEEQLDSVLLQQQDIIGASQHIYTKEKSIILGTEPAILCEDALSDDKESGKDLLVVEEPNDLSIVPVDKIHADVFSRSKVTEALNLYEQMMMELSKKREEAEKEGKSSTRQIHVEAAVLLKEQQKWVNTEKVIGAVPGVEIGDRFRFRAELAVVGLHHQFQGGIDYLKNDGEILATSIVNSGRYPNGAAESSDVMIYSGQGGNPKVGNKPPEDQKLERGNLALKNSIGAGTPVRVILKSSNTSGTTYTYDGLYMVTKCRQERGEYGKLVYKFELNRLAAQPKLTGELMPKKSIVSKLPSVADDISRGKEKKPIRVVNTVDDEKPPPFEYITNVIYQDGYNHSVLDGCDCVNGCSDFEECPCTMRNGGDIPFNSKGAIVWQKPLVYECGPSCKCPPSCQNRVSQHGVQYQLEIFKTDKMGWGVRSRDYISSGSFICKYTGELLQEREAEQRAGNDEYLFDVGKVETTNDEATNDDGDFTIDAAKHGNVGRFINHSCSPNLYAQNVLYDHNDKRMPRIMFFATKNIRPLRELTYDYNYKVDHVLDANGNIKKKNCYCGSRDCSGRMY